MYATPKMSVEEVPPKKASAKEIDDEYTKLVDMVRESDFVGCGCYVLIKSPFRCGKKTKNSKETSTFSRDSQDIPCREDPASIGTTRR